MSGVRRWIATLATRGRPEEAPIVYVEPDPAAVRPDRGAEQEPEREAEPQPVVSERTARALLATGTPPLPPEPPKLERRRRLERRPEPKPPEPEPVVATPPREWNIWELQRAVRVADDPERQEEWSALFIHLREFANAEGSLPVEFDELVRDSFAGILEGEREGAAS